MQLFDALCSLRTKMALAKIVNRIVLDQKLFSELFWACRDANAGTAR